MSVLQLDMLIASGGMFEQTGFDLTILKYTDKSCHDKF